MNHEISLDQAIDLTKRFRTLRSTVLNPIYEHTDIIANCETFDCEAIQTLINNPECKSIRIYYGMSEDMKVHAVLVSVDANGNDLIPAEGNDNKIMENGQRCPDTCPSPSPLNC